MRIIIQIVRIHKIRIMQSSVLKHIFQILGGRDIYETEEANEKPEANKIYFHWYRVAKSFSVHQVLSQEIYILIKVFFGRKCVLLLMIRNKINKYS